MLKQKIKSLYKSLTSGIANIVPVAVENKNQIQKIKEDDGIDDIISKIIVNTMNSLEALTPIERESDQTIMDQLLSEFHQQVTNFVEVNTEKYNTKSINNFFEFLKSSKFEDVLLQQSNECGKHPKIIAAEYVKLVFIPMFHTYVPSMQRGHKFLIESNNYLKTPTVGYYHQLYTGFNRPGNPDFLNTLKNTFGKTSQSDLNDAMHSVILNLEWDIPYIIRQENIFDCVCVGIPRAKAFKSYTRTQTMLNEGIKIAIKKIRGISDGTGCIIREKDTRTTHLNKAAQEGRISNNTGDMPYPGITKDTCSIRSDMIRDKCVLLIDDIYTPSVNIDEDCIQALLDNGAKKVVFYSIGYTQRN